MRISLREAMTLGGLSQAKVVAGKAGMDNPVDSITTIEVAEDSIGDWLQENQLCIIAMYYIKDDLEKQLNLIRILHEKSCAGLIVCHVGIWMKELSHDLIDLCDKLSLPLIEAQPNTTYLEILTPVIRQLVSDELPVPSQYAEIESTIIDLIVSETSVVNVLKKITCNFKRKITYLDSHCNCIFSNKPLKEMEDDKTYIKDNFNYIFPELLRKRYVEQQDSFSHRIIRLVEMKHITVGFIILEVLDQETFGEVSAIAETLNTVCALMSNRKVKTVDMKEHYIKEYISDLLIWNFRSVEVAVKRGLDAGIAIDKKNTFIIINLNDLHKLGECGEENFIAVQTQDTVLLHVRTLFARYDSDSIVILRSDQILILLDDQGNREELKKLSLKSLDFFAHIRTTISIGISNSFQLLHQIPDAYNQAAQAALLGREYFGKNKALFYADVFFNHHICTMRNDKEAVSVSHRLLQPLNEYDNFHGTILLETLRLLIWNNNDVTNLSKKMYIHRNTLLHRKNKIVEILGYSPFEMPHFLNVLIALEIMKE